MVAHPQGKGVNAEELDMASTAVVVIETCKHEVAKDWERLDGSEAAENL
jgi:hypothetical protein